MTNLRISLVKAISAAAHQEYRVFLASLEIGHIAKAKNGWWAFHADGARAGQLSWPTRMDAATRLAISHRGQSVA